MGSPPPNLQGMYLRRLALLVSVGWKLEGTLQTSQRPGSLWAALRSSKRTFATGLGFEALSHVDLSGQTVCVTGSTDGIGRTTAHLLAQHGATVLVHGRDPRRVRRMLRSVQQSSSNPNVFGYAYDLSSVAQTAAFAAHVRRDVQSWFGGKLHCLVNNAGVFEDDTIITGDGLEYTWAVNVAAPFILTGELLDLITDRIVNVSSISMADTLDWGQLKQAERMPGGHQGYGISKLALNMLTYRLAGLLEHTSVTVNCIDPGTVNTKLCYAGWGFVSHVAQRVEDADDEFWAASSPDLAAVTGKYFVSRKPRLSPPFSYDEAAQDQLWHLLEEQTGVRYRIPTWLRR